MSWIKRNFKSIIYFSFIVPIILVALVSISHVTNWYGVTNPASWSIYLSVAVEIAALAALAAISAEMGSKVYFPFAIVTIIQFVGNIFYSYTYINVESKEFKDWIDLITPIAELFNIEKTDIVGHKRILSMFSGGMLPLISLSFLHMLVKFRSSKMEPAEVVEEKQNDDVSGLIDKIEELEKKLSELKQAPRPTEPEITPDPTPEPTPTETEQVSVVDDIPETTPEVTQQELEVPKEDPLIPKIKRLSYTRRNG